MNISIKNPCHENWSDMTPNEQGAFCGKCIQTVIDFSSKTLDEIKDFFSNTNEQKICGRFETKQITKLSFENFYQNFKLIHFNKRIAFVIVLTFGSWLFGSNTIYAQTNTTTQNQEQFYMKGDVANEPIKKDSIKPCVIPVEEKNMIMGKIIAPKNVVQPKEEKFLLGEVKAPVKKKFVKKSKNSTTK